MEEDIIRIYHPDHGAKDVSRKECNERVADGWFYNRESAVKKSTRPAKPVAATSKKYK